MNMEGHEPERIQHTLSYHEEQALSAIIIVGIVMILITVLQAISIHNLQKEVKAIESNKDRISELAGRVEDLRDEMKTWN